MTTINPQAMDTLSQATGRQRSNPQAGNSF